MRWVLLVLLVVPLALALPTPPGIPTRDYPVPTDGVFLHLPATSGATYSGKIEHNSSKIYLCNLSLDGTASSKNIMTPFTLAPDQNKSFSGTTTGGSHTLYARCVNGTDLIQVSRQFTAQTTYRIFMLKPTGTVPGPKVNVTFKHNAADSLVCTATIDSDDWEDDDENWQDSDLTKHATVAPNTEKKIIFNDVDDGAHKAFVNCSVPSVKNSTSFIVGTPSSVKITILSPPNTTNSTLLNASFMHDANSTGNCTVKIDGTTRYKDLQVPEESLVRYAFNTTAGSHTLLVSCKGVGWSTSAERVFLVRGNTTNTTPVNLSKITLTVLGAPIMEDDPFTVKGTGWPIREDLNLSLLGGGIREAETVSTSASGGFTYAFDGKPAGSYVITATQASDPRVLKTLTVVVEEEVVPCTESWDCSAWSDCTPDGSKSRSCEDTNACGTELKRPDETETCRYTPSCTDGVQNGQEEGVDCGGLCALVCPDTQQPAPVGTSIWMWLIPVIILVLLLGGFLGYLAVEGDLDLSSWDGFTSGVSRAFGSAPQVSRAAVIPHASAAESATVRSFITQERAKGYDDLTIRSALLAKGWHKDVVDEVFSGIYQESFTGAAAHGTSGPRA